MFQWARRFRGIGLFGSTFGIAALLATTLFALPPKEKEEKEPPEKLSKQEKRRRKDIQKEMEDPYKRWLSDEVPYIITDPERASFKKLSTAEEREQFIEAFWERRNPNPGSPENEFKEEYYRRIDN